MRPGISVAPCEDLEHCPMHLGIDLGVEGVTLVAPRRMADALPFLGGASTAYRNCRASLARGNVLF